MKMFLILVIIYGCILLGNRQEQQIDKALTDTSINKHILNRRIFSWPLTDKARRFFLKHTYSCSIANICQCTTLSYQEQAYQINRLAYIKPKLERLLNITLADHEVPRIAICCSGGGYRSLIYTMGALLNPWLLESALYISTLSGSSWFLASWYARATNINEYKQYVIERLKNSLFGASLSEREVIQYFLKKWAYGQTFSFVDAFGFLLARHLLFDGITNPDRLSLDMQQELLKDGSWPMPIYTAITPTANYYEWVEFTPYEIGCSYLGGFIPSWSFGRVFYKGISQNFALAPSLGYLMGIWGSAFALTAQDVIRLFRNKISCKALLAALEVSSRKIYILNSLRVMPAKVYNMSLGLMDIAQNKKKKLVFVDAGIDFNLPMPPLLRKERMLDMIIIIDASQDITKGRELRSAELYCKRNNIKIPFIDYSTLDVKSCSIFQDASCQGPIIAYLPRIKNSGYSEFNPDNYLDSFCSTFNFKYNKEQIEQLSGLAKYNVQESKKLIMKALKERILVKRNFK